LVSARAAGSSSSRLVSGVAVILLIVVVSLSVALIDSHSLADPLQANLLRPADAPLPKPGILSVQMFSNQDFSTIVSAPLKAPIAVPDWPMTLTTINSSVISVTPLSFSLDSEGVAHVPLLPGLYILSAPYNTLNIEIPVNIFSGNTTSVQLNVFEGAFPVLFSEAADVGAEPSVYVELSSSAPAANVSEPVTLQVRNGGSGGGYQVDATVTSQWPPAQRTEWLELAPMGTLDLAGAESVVLATWAYSSSVSVGPTGPSAPLAA
jgi:hypothetical protein